MGSIENKYKRDSVSIVLTPDENAFLCKCRQNPDPQVGQLFEVNFSNKVLPKMGEDRVEAFKRRLEIAERNRNGRES